jgi:hypothetical protein
MVANGEVEETHRLREETPAKKGLFNMFNRLHHHCSSQQSSPTKREAASHPYSHSIPPYATYDSAKHRKFATEGAHRPTKRPALRLEH